MFSIAFLTDWDGYEPEIFPDSRSVPQKNPFAEYNVRYIVIPSGMTELTLFFFHRKKTPTFPVSDLKNTAVLVR